MVVPVVWVGQRDAYEPRPVPLAAAHKAAPRGERIAGFPAYAAFAAPEQLVVVIIALLAHLPRRGGDDSDKVLIAHTVVHQHGHVARGRIVILSVKPVRI